MEELRTDSLSAYSKNTTETAELDSSKNSENNGTVGLLNGCEEIEDLDLMENCENIGSPNSDVWKGSDSEEESFDQNKTTSEATQHEEAKENDEINEAEDMQTIDDTSKTAEADHSSKAAEADDTNKADEADDIDKAAEADDIDKAAEADDTNEAAEADDTNKAVEADDTIAVAEADDASKTTEADDITEIVESEKDDEEETTDNNQTDQQTEANQSDVIEIDDAADETDQGQTETTEIVEEADKSTDDVQIIEDTVENNAETETPEKSSDISEADKVEEANVNNEPSKENDTTDKSSPTPDISSDKEVAVVETDPLATDNEKDPLALDSSPEKEPSTSRQPNRNNEDQEQDDCQMDYDAEDDDDFDPSLLCPELSMEVDENPVITTNGSAPHDGASPTLCEPLHSTFVDEVTGAEIAFNLTAEEFELKKSLYPPTNPIQNGRVHCTACNVHLGSALEGQHNRFVHPLLKVLICKDCYHFYTSGEFEKDEDGSELYCRWCGQGGQVLCCSKCEYVFCKKCIRTNFGRKKMFEIRDSDAWDCFRCNMVQIMTQRVACFEFFEYVRREMQRAATLNTSEIWGVDYTRCCSYKKRPAENNENQEAKKAKKKKSNVDPDYDPIAEKLKEVAAAQAGVITIGMPQPPQAPAPKKMIPKPMTYIPRVANKQKDNDIEFVRTIPPPQVGMNQIRPQNNTMPMYRAIFPQYRPVVQPTVLRLAPQMTSQMPITNRILTSTLQSRPLNTSNLMKHEWFEKTVRAAARVNSHLSYTLTQLNKAQSQAASVEELAVVHNKLQEILSSSINSLIQIRKNLRTEFIAGIKTVRLPSRKPETFTNDDDVIIVNAPTLMPMPSMSLAPLVSMANMAPPPPRPETIVVVDKSLNRTTPLDVLTLNKPGVSSANLTPNAEKPKMYLKVKSVSELQNVPSECINIPDDIPTTSGITNKTPTKTPTKTLTKTPTKTPVVEVVCNGVSNAQPTASNSVNKTPEIAVVTLTKLKLPKDKIPTPTKPDSDPKNSETLSTKRARESSGPKVRDLRTRMKGDESMVYDAKNLSSPEAKRMFSVSVRIEKVDLEKLQKRLTM